MLPPEDCPRKRERDSTVNQRGAMEVAADLEKKQFKVHLQSQEQPHLRFRLTAKDSEFLKVHSKERREPHQTAS